MPGNTPASLSQVHPTPRVIIAGFGLVSPLGTSAWTTFGQLLKGRTISDRADQLSGDINAVDLVRALGGVAVARHSATDPAVDLAERAGREAMFGVTGREPVSCVVGASKGAMHALTGALDNVRASGEHRNQLKGRWIQPPTPDDAALAVALGPMGYLAWHLHRRLGLSDVQTVVAACASGLTAVHKARLMLTGDNDVHSGASDVREQGRGTFPRRILVVSSEAALLPVFIHSYRRLGVLPPMSPAAFRGRPLDRARNGFMLSELGAAVLLERVNDVHDGDIELLDTAVAAEAFDIVRTSPDMPALRRVADRLFARGPIDVLHPHATGTQEHDEVEMRVYASTLGSGPLKRAAPHAYASKGALGHGLGAAGLVSLVIACLCAKSRRVPPMPWLTDPIDTPFPLKPQASSLKPASTHAVFAAGFGGHVAGAVICSY